MTHNNNQSESKRLGTIFLVIGWILFLGLVSFLSHYYLYAPKTPIVIQNNAGTKITIPRSEDSHFHIMGAVNSIPISFLIDTGATTVTIPEKIAHRAKLVRERKITAQTANGLAEGYITSIPKLTIGPLIFEDVRAIIIPELGDNDGLLGMNILQYFNIEQNYESMILTID